MKIPICFSIFLLLATALSGQTLERQLVGAAGFSTATTAGTLHSSVGEPAVRSVADGTGLTWNEGFQQAASAGTSTLHEAPEADATLLRVWPNPTTGVLNVQTGMPVQLTWFDLTGRVLGSVSAADNAATIDLSQHPSGIYLVRMADQQGRVLKTVRIVRR